MISAPGDPPGSRVSFVWMPNDRSRSARIDAWVDFPVPSPPSKVMKRPRISQPLLAWLLAISEPPGWLALKPAT